MIQESKAVQIQHLVVGQFSRPSVSWARTIVETDDWNWIQNKQIQIW